MLPVAQLAKGDSEFVKSKSVKEFVIGFAKESVLAKDSKAVINIFKSETTTNALFSLSFINKEKLAEVLQELVHYSATIENDPSKNPFLGAFADVATDSGNIAIENALDKYIAPGLGTFAKGVRIGGSGINTFARAVDLFNSTARGQKATITLSDISKASVRTLLFDHKKFVRSTFSRSSMTIQQLLSKDPDFLKRTDYFYKEIDLNNDDIKEIILVVFSPMCGASECHGYILKKSELEYKVLGIFGVTSSGGEIVATQQSSNNGFMDIATHIYDRTRHMSVWKLHRFDGNTYGNTYQDLNSPPSRVILNVKRGSGLKL
jgi:hypothetical protein